MTEFGDRAPDWPGAGPADLDLVQRRIIGCDRCPRLRAHCQRIGREKRAAFRHETYWARPVPGFGDPRARLLIVGLAPAAHGANRTGRLFTGDGVGGSGDVLAAAMHAEGFANRPTSRRSDDGLRLTDAFVTAAVRCAPPHNRPTPLEIATCHAHLSAEVDALSRVRVVVALGRVAFHACWRLAAGRGVRPRPKPRFGHGLAHQLDRFPTVVASYHPSRQNTSTGRLTPAMMRSVFRTARRWLDHPRSAPGRLS